MKNKLGTVKSHIREVEKLCKVMEKVLPDFKRFTKLIRDFDFIKIVNGDTVMYTKDISDKTPYRDGNKNLITPESQYCFLQSGINRNGVDSTGRIARTYSIDYYLSADIKPYRCQRTCETQINKIYIYAESIEEVVRKFKERLK